MDRSSMNRMLPGLILIALGVIFLLSRTFVALSGAVLLGGLGALFIFAYFATRKYGWLIPGSILAGLGFGELIGWSSLGLGLGFIGIFVIDVIVRGKSHWWPLIPGVIITLDALGDRANVVIAPLRNLISNWWPLLLIVIGLWLLFQNRRKT
jgi:hypothetical protein